ncbi:MAG: hypothetical protein CL927_02575 [Deltaproteobacteria bacterium]|nr:hypothetical protein [Deltaproteobacteria bacterium]
MTRPLPMTGPHFRTPPRLRTSRLPTVLVAAGLLAGCAGGGATDKYNLTVLEPEAVITPTGIDFGDVIVPYTAADGFTIINEGAADLTIDDIYLTSNDNDAFTVEWDNTDPVVIERDTRIEVAVGFAPPLYEDFSGTLVVVSDDPETPNQYIPLTGSGIDGPIPELVAEPGALDFGLVEIGTTGQEQLLLINQGGGDVTIESATLDGSSAFSVPDLSGTDIYGNNEKLILVEYRPTDESGDNATLTLLTNDPTNPEREIFMLGNGGGDFQYPDADIDCPARVNPPTAVPLDGRGSTDPMNPDGELQYDWTVLTAPEGSSTTDVLDPGKAYTSLFADLAGTWTVQLVVENLVGLRSDPAVCTFEAIPPKNLHIELLWDTGNSDLDLHLVQGGYEMYQLPGDCNYCNPTPAWEGGDPTLALDNRVGYGPENINMDGPADGDYDVWVYYFADSGGGETIATVRVWLNGAKVWEGSELMTRGQAWHAGYVRWINPDGTFNALSGAAERWEGATNCYTP